MNNPHVLNLTLQLDQDIIPAWITAIEKDILPQVIDGEIIISADVRKIINPNPEEVPSFAVQFTFPSVQIYNERKLERLSIFVELMDKSFANKYVYFATLMEVLHYNGIST
jgi:hypothetical protein